MGDRLAVDGMRASLLVMQSSGGVVPAAVASEVALGTLDSGPTAGLTGVAALAAARGDQNVVATDMGGTSFDIGLVVDGHPVVANESVIDQYTYRIPHLDIRATACGAAAVAMLTAVAADELGRYGATVNAVAPAARTRLTGWLGDGPGGPDRDPWAPEHVAPVVAWLLSPSAREITGRVIEAGNGQISVPGGWRPGTAYPLPPLMSPAQARTLLPQVLASAQPLPGLLTPDAALSDRGGPAQLER
jgi:hypothetical protein